MFVAGFWTLAASWVGYHQSIRSKPIKSGFRFILDILLLALYIFLLLYFRSPSYTASIITIIYVTYISWDFYKTKEYPDEYYNNGTPNGLKYLAKCLADWIQPGRHLKLRSEVVTVGWTAFYLILLPFSFIPAVETDWGKIGFAITIVVANHIYRYDKRNQGTWICSTPFKLVMAGMIAYLVLYYTNILCFTWS
jgi:hypothetical protein